MRIWDPLLINHSLMKRFLAVRSSAASGQIGVWAVNSSTCTFLGLSVYSLFLLQVDALTAVPSICRLSLKIFFTCVLNGRVMERFYWLEPHVTQIKSRDFLLCRFIPWRRGAQRLNHVFRSQWKCVITHVLRVNPRHFWSFIQGFNTLFYILGSLRVDCNTCIASE